MHAGISRFVIYCLLAVAVAAEQPGGTLAPPNSERAVSRFNFTLMPKAFQKNPTLEMTVNTQLTAHGRTLPEASTAQPVYYIAHDSGYRQMGETMGEHPPPPVKLQEHLIDSLKARGYLPAQPGHPPTLALFFYWGSHNSMDRETAAMFPELQAQQQLERAVLIGGDAYRKKESERMAFGRTPADNLPQDEYLRYQELNDLYYAVVSAYDYAALARKERKLAWRTTMTVNSTGVSMTESLPVLLASSSFYFGRETREPVAVMREARRGTVTLGPLLIIERAPARTAQPSK